MAEPADDARDRRCTGAEALAYLLDARHVAEVDRPPPPFDETLELFRLYYHQTPAERIGFMVLVRIYAQLEDPAAGQMLLQAAKLIRRRK